MTTFDSPPSPSPRPSGASRLARGSRGALTAVATVALACAMTASASPAAVVEGKIFSADKDSIAIVPEGSSVIRRYRILFDVPVRFEGRKASRARLLKGYYARVILTPDGVVERIYVFKSQESMRDDVPVVAARKRATTIGGVPIIPDPPRPSRPIEPPSPPDSPAVTDDRTTAARPPAATDSSPVRPASAEPAEIGDVVSYRPNWPQFRGPDRANRSTDHGLLDRWPENGPRLLWVARGLGEGYSSVSTDGRLLLTMGNLQDHESVIALDFETGRIRWTYRNGPAYRNGQGNGPRSTPTIDRDRLYALGASGDLSCAELATGRVLWRRNILRDFGGRNITWGISESVLIDGEKLICTPGGSKATVAALNKGTGETLWTAQVTGRPQASYASPIAITVGGVRQYVVFTSKNVVGIEAETGRELWSDASSSNSTANCSTPVFEGDLLFSASGYGTGGACLRLLPQRGGTAARLLYTTKEMKNHHGGMVVVDGYLYGSSDPGILTCIQLQTGRVMWKNRSVGKGSVTYADGHIYLRSERGPVALVRATPEGYEERGRFQQPERSSRPAWPHPVVTGGRLFLRDMDVLLCFDLRPEFQ